MNQGIIVYDGNNRTVACISQQSKSYYDMYVRQGTIGGKKIIGYCWMDEPFVSKDKDVVLDAVIKANRNDLVSIIQNCRDFSSPI